MVTNALLDTAIERTIADGRHWVSNGDARQAGAAGERRVANACYGENYNSLEIILLPYFE